MTPSHAYYHYTIARDEEMFSVGPPGTPITVSVTHNFLLEICATPPRPVGLRHSIPGGKYCLREMFSVGPPGIEPGLYEPESYVLPAYSGPTQNTSRHEDMLVVKNNLLVVTRKFSRPCLAVFSADKTSPPEYFQSLIASLKRFGSRSGSHQQAKSDLLRFLLAGALRKNRTCDLSRVRRTL